MRAELFDRAADCERQTRLAQDPHKQAALRFLRDMWIKLARDSASMLPRIVAKEIGAIEELQVTTDNLAGSSLP